MADIKQRMQNELPKLGINIYLSLHFLSVPTFYPNTVYLQLPQSTEAFWVYKDSEKYEKVHKLHKKLGKLSKFSCFITN